MAMTKIRAKKPMPAIIPKALLSSWAAQKQISTAMIEMIEIKIPTGAKTLVENRL